LTLPHVGWCGTALAQVTQSVSAAGARNRRTNTALPLVRSLTSSAVTVRPARVAVSRPSAIHTPAQRRRVRVAGAAATARVNVAPG
jgi:hypothetical protein